MVSYPACLAIGRALPPSSPARPSLCPTPISHAATTSEGASRVPSCQRQTNVCGTDRAGLFFGVSRPSAIMPREGVARERRSEMIRTLLIVVVIVAGLMLWFLIPFLDLP